VGFIDWNMAFTIIGGMSVVIPIAFGLAILLSG
jgi:hypothetical protein